MEDLTFSNIMAVVAYLKLEGWKIGKSSVFTHAKQGKLRRREDGVFHEKDVKKYARTFLKPLDPETMQSEAIEKLQKKRIEAEVKKLEAQASHWDIRAKIEAGDYVRKDAFEKALAQRVLIFKNGIEKFCITSAPEIIHFVNGDISKVSDLAEYLLDKTADWLNCYSEDKEWKVPPGVFVTDTEDHEGTEDMEGDDDESEQSELLEIGR